MRWLDDGASLKPHDRRLMVDGDTPTALSFAELTKRPAWHADALRKVFKTVSWYPVDGAGTAKPKEICGVSGTCRVLGGRDGQR